MRVDSVHSAELGKLPLCPPSAVNTWRQQTSQAQLLTPFPPWVVASETRGLEKPLWFPHRSKKKQSLGAGGKTNFRTVYFISLDVITS